MDNDVIIDVKNVSKSYKLYDRPIERLKETLHPKRKKYHKDFYALKDVCFQIKKGETVGIIGKNGAGKSTLLKIITGVLTPSSGTVTVNGKIASLLELGAGFNPEFTGKENIYLNGTIMGYTREEIDAKLPAILEFADIGDFVYQPVKTYSSGMYVRLAFSLAINVEPEILIVDEALAVGDAKFQRKCFARLEALKANHTTIVFVTHEIETVKQLCSKAMLINAGHVISVGDPKDVAIEYFDILFPKIEEGPKDLFSLPKPKIENIKTRSTIRVKPDSKIANSFGMGGADIECIDISGMENNVFSGGEKVEIDVYFYYDEDFIKEISIEEQVKENIIVGISVSDVKGTYLFGMTTYDKDILLAGDRKDGKGKITFVFNMPYLQSGDYVFNSAIALGTQENHVQLKWYDGLVSFKMQSSKRYVYGVFYQEYEVEKEGIGC